jgi:hypothetical protein
VGTLIALTFLLTLEDPHRFGKSRDVGCYLGPQPGRRRSGQSEPQLHISKEGDPYLRTLLVQGAQHILGPFGIDCDLRAGDLNWPSVVEGVARNERSWPLRESWRCCCISYGRAEKCTNRCTTAAERQWRQPRKTKMVKQSQNRFRKRKDKCPEPSSGDCVNRLARVPLSKSRTSGRQTDGSTG